VAHGKNNPCIGTSTGPYVDRSDLPRVEDQESKIEGYYDHAGAPGYGMGPDGRKRQRRMTLANERVKQLNSMADVSIAQGVVGRSVSNGAWPLYSETIDSLPECS